MIIACNTLHKYFSYIKDNSKYFLFHLPNLVLKEAKNKNIKKILVLSTESTQISKLYEKKGIEIIYPDKKGKKIISKAIDNILEGKIFLKDSIALQKYIHNYYKKNQFEAVILGCTELPVLHDNFPLILSNIEILNSINIASKNVLKNL